MGQILPGIIVSVFNPKGGVGKSTLTAIFAGYIQSNSIKDSLGLSIGVVDADDAQNTVGDMRIDESSSLSNTDYQVMNISSSEISERIEYLRKSFDIILIDFPGNLKQDGVVEALHLIDVLIIPFEPNDVSIRATLKFYEIYKEKVLKTREEYGFSTTIKGVPNRVSSNVKEYKDLIENKGSLPFKLMDNHVKESKVEFQRNITTLISEYQNNAESFCEEVLNLIIKHIK